MDIYPFFLDCCKHHTDDTKIKLLESLALGNSDLILKRGKNTKVLVTSKGEFIIPDHYTETLGLKLDEFLWNSTDGYYKMQNDIKKSYESWTNVKKKDKLRMIDYYVLSKHRSSSPESVILKSIVTIALMLKLINASNITYEGGEIVAMDENAIKDRVYSIDIPLAFPSLSKTKLKTLWLKWLKSMDTVSLTTDKQSIMDDADSSVDE